MFGTRVGVVMDAAAAPVWQLDVPPNVQKILTAIGVVLIVAAIVWFIIGRVKGRGGRGKVGAQIGLILLGGLLMKPELLSAVVNAVVPIIAWIFNWFTDYLGGVGNGGGGDGTTPVDLS